MRHQSEKPVRKVPHALYDIIGFPGFELPVPPDLVPQCKVIRHRVVSKRSKAVEHARCEVENAAGGVRKKRRTDSCCPREG